MSGGHGETKEEWFAGGLRFDCTQCGNCCTGPAGYVWVETHEMHQIAEYLGITVKEFRRRYTRKVHGRWSLDEIPSGAGFDCVFLRRDPDGKARCSIHPARPTQCRTWPFWPENLKSPRTWKQTAKICPGVAQGLKGIGTHHSADEVRADRDATPPR